MRSQLRGDRYRFSDRYRSCRGRSRCAWSWSLTAASHIVQRACSLPAGEIGVTASGCTLSQVALVIASGHAGDYLPLLPAHGQKSQDGWPDVKHRRVLRRLSLSLLLFLKCRWQFLLRLEALFFYRHFRLFCRILPGSFLCLSGSSSLGAICGVAGRAAPSAGSGFRCALRLLQLVQSLLVLRLRCLLELVIRLLPAAVPGVPGPMQRQVDFLFSGGQCRSSSGGFDWRDVSQVAVPFAYAFFSSAGKLYRSSSVFRGSGPCFSSTYFWSLLHWRRLSVVLPASAVDCRLSSLRAGVCSLLWQSPAFLSFRCGGTAPSPVPWMLVASTGFRSIMAYSRLYFG